MWTTVSRAHINKATLARPGSRSARVAVSPHESHGWVGWFFLPARHLLGTKTLDDLELLPKLMTPRCMLTAWIESVKEGKMRFSSRAARSWPRFSGSLLSFPLSFFDFPALKLERDGLSRSVRVAEGFCRCAAASCTSCRRCSPRQLGNLRADRPNLFQGTCSDGLFSCLHAFTFCSRPV